MSALTVRKHIACEHPRPWVIRGADRQVIGRFPTGVAAMDFARRLIRAAE
jgi:hypothetical protein